MKMTTNQPGAQNMIDETIPKSLFVTNVSDLVIKDMLERKWLKWWNPAEDIEVDK